MVEQQNSYPAASSLRVFAVWYFVLQSFVFVVQDLQPNYPRTVFQLIVFVVPCVIAGFHYLQRHGHCPRGRELVKLTFGSLAALYVVWVAVGLILAFATGELSFSSNLKLWMFSNFQEVATVLAVIVGNGVMFLVLFWIGYGPLTRAVGYPSVHCQE